MAVMLNVKEVLIENIAPSSTGLKKKTAQNAAWSSLSMGVRVALTLISMPIMARLLSPEDFGIAALAILATELVVLFGEFGLQTALIQRKRVYRGDLETAFWSETAIGFVLAAMVVIVSPLVAWFFDQPILQDVLYLTALGLIIASLSSVHRTILVRTMCFKTLSVIEILSALIRVGSAISLAWAGYGFWALVLGGIIGFVASAILRFVFIPWIPRLRFQTRRFAYMFRFGRNILGDNMLNYVSENVDNILVGKHLGTDALGYYQLAFTMPDMIRKNFQQLLSRVLFPAYSRVQDEEERLQTGFLRAVEAVALFAFPLMGGLLVVAPVFVPVYFGAQWEAIIVPTQFLCIAGAARSIMAMCGPVVHARGRPDLTMKLSLVRLPLLALAIWTGMQWGIDGTAGAVMIFSLFWMLVFTYVTAGVVNLPVKRILGATGPALMATIIMVLVVWYTFGRLEYFGLEDWIVLAVLVTLGGIVYLAAAAVLCREHLLLVVNLVKSVRSR